MSGTRVDSLKALASELGDGAHVLPADLSSAEVATQLIADATAAMGRIDILVNNSGLTRDTLAMRMKDDDWQLILDVNFRKKLSKNGFNQVKEVFNSNKGLSNLSIIIKNTIN